MPDYLTTKELAELLRIKERKVYDLASSGALPCSKALGNSCFHAKPFTPGWPKMDLAWICRAAH